MQNPIATIRNIIKLSLKKSPKTVEVHDKVLELQPEQFFHPYGMVSNPPTENEMLLFNVEAQENNAQAFGKDNNADIDKLEESEVWLRIPGKKTYIKLLKNEDVQLINADKKLDILASPENGTIEITLDKTIISFDKDGNMKITAPETYELEVGQAKLSVGKNGKFTFKTAAGPPGHLSEHNQMKIALDAYVTQMNTHTHVSAAQGSPTGPPSPPGQLQIDPAEIADIEIQ